MLSQYSLFLRRSFIFEKNFLLCYLSFEIFILKYCSLFLSIHVRWFFWQDVTCSECHMLGKWHIENVECGMLGMWDVGDVRCWRCGMLGIGMLGMWDVRHVWCQRYEMCRIWDVQDVECPRCGMFGMWDVQDVGCSGCGMCGLWDVWDVGCLGCGMWDVGCLSACGILIYKMPSHRWYAWMFLAKIQKTVSPLRSWLFGLFQLYTVTLKFPFSSYELVVEVVACRWYVECFS